MEEGGHRSARVWRDYKVEGDGCQGGEGNIVVQSVPGSFELPFACSKCFPSIVWRPTEFIVESYQLHIFNPPLQALPTSSASPTPLPTHALGTSTTSSAHNTIFLAVDDLVPYHDFVISL